MADDVQQHLEYALYDVLDDICHCLDVTSLRNVALVSRSWSHSAMKELSKRKPGSLCRVLLPTLYTEDAPEFNADDFFIDKPNTVLMFCGPRPRVCPVLDLQYKVLGSFHKRIPGRMVMLGVDEAMTTVDAEVKEVRSCRMQRHEKPDARTLYNQIVGLSLPESEDIAIEIAECVSHENRTEEKAADVFRRLHAAAEGVEHPIFLLFGRSGYTIGYHVMRMFRNEYAGKSVSLWGGTIADHIKRSDDGYPDYRGTHGFLGILMHGPKLRAHCAVVPIDDDGDARMTERLAEFRRGIKLRRRSVGLVSGPRDSSRRFARWVFDEEVEQDTRRFFNSEDLMKMVKREFGGIEFTGMFNSSEFSYYGCDHGSKNGDYSLEHKQAMCVMILTYD